MRILLLLLFIVSLQTQSSTKCNELCKTCDTDRLNCAECFEQYELTEIKFCTTPYTESNNNGIIAVYVLCGVSVLVVIIISLICYFCHPCPPEVIREGE